MTKRKKEKVLLSSYCKDNDLLYLLEEWDYQNNNEKTPDDYTFGSKKSVFWICRQCGSSYPARINTRVHDRTRVCNDCAKKESWKTRHKNMILANNLATDYQKYVILERGTESALSRRTSAFQSMVSNTVLYHATVGEY